MQTLLHITRVSPSLSSILEAFPQQVYFYCTRRTDVASGSVMVCCGLLVLHPSLTGVRHT